MGHTLSSMSQAYLLVDAVRRLGRRPADRRAVHIHLSKLRRSNREPRHIQIAASAFEDQVKTLSGHIYLLGNGDLVFLWRDAPAEEVSTAVERLRQMFSEDPLAQLPVTETDDPFSTWYELEEAYDSFLALVSDTYERELHAQQAADLVVLPRARSALTPLQLAKIEDAVAQADLSNLMRRQAICALVGNALPQPVFQELYISIADLGETLVPGVDLQADRWLFRYMTRALDRRLLALLERNDDSSIANAFSINLNVESLLCDAFLGFDERLGTIGRHTVIIEVSLTDIFADFREFAFARDFLRGRGYRLCIDRVDHQTLAFADRRRLDVDFVKLTWDAAALADAPEEMLESLREQVAAIGKSRVILGRCDEPAAIAFGQEIGITLYQGWLVDNMISAHRQGPPIPRPARRLLRA